MVQGTDAAGYYPGVTATGATCYNCGAQLHYCTCTTYGTATTAWAWVPPELVEIKIDLPRKPKPWKLQEAKRKEQLKMWGLRK